MSDTDQPRATETEQEQGPERIREEEDMRGYEHGEPELPAETPDRDDAA